MDNNKVVYAFWDPTREEYIYVGKGDPDRPNKHFRRKDKHPFVHRLTFIKKNGSNAEIHLLYSGITDLQAKAFEIFWIASIGRKDQGRGPLLNLRDGGDGPNHSAESRKKMSDSRKGKIPWNKGKELTQEQKDHLSKINKENPSKGNLGRTYTLTSEQKEKLKGRIPWNKGLTGFTHTEETKLKISKSTTGVPKPPFTQEHRDNIGAAQRGKKRK